MSTPQFKLRVIASVAPDIGEEPSILIDTDLILPLALAGFPGWKQVQVQVPVSAVDQAVTFTDAVALIVLSDQPISVKTKAGETPGTAQLFHSWCAKDATHACSPAGAGGILLSNPGTAIANVTILVIEKGS